MDHEFSTGGLDPDQVGWDWFGLHLDDGSELMLYRMRRADGGATPRSSATFVDRQGDAHHVSCDGFAAIPLDARWRSPATGAAYPLDWLIRVPAHDLVLRISPHERACELATERSTGVVYWEGPVKVERVQAGVGNSTEGSPAVDRCATDERPAEGAATPVEVVGQGYMELTGYAERFGSQH
jgi:predicted secreted hydrolase